MRILLLLSLVALTSCIKYEQCDLVIHNATVISMDQMQTVAQAIAVKDGRILEIGKEHDILNKYRYDEHFDARKGTVFPGFIDAHCHFLGYGLSAMELDLKGTKNFEEVIARIQAYSKTNKTTWIEGRGWDHTDWPGGRYPTKFELDKLFPDTPILVRRVDGHAALANQKAFDLTGVNANTTVEGGVFSKTNGLLNGIIMDNAIDFMRNQIKGTDEAKTKAALLLAQDSCFKYGLTAICDAGMESKDIEIIKSLNDSALIMHIYAMLSDNDVNVAYAKKHGIQTNKRLSVRSFKFYGDGSLGSRGACLKHPYHDVDTTHFGMMLSSVKHYEERAKLMDSLGFQMNTHCIGDSANKTLLQIYANQLKGINDKRWRIEHAQVVEKADLALFQTNSIIPSVQPTHATSDMKWANQRLGDERTPNAYSYQELKEQLGLIAFGTDFPVEAISPILTYYAAVSRKDVNGNPESGFLMNNKMSRLDAMKAMTIWAALANFQELNRGTIEPGKVASFTVLDRNIMKVPEEHIPGTRIEATIVEGKVVYRR